MTRANLYSGAGLDRADRLRGDREAMSRVLGDPATRFVAVWRARNLVAPGDPENGPAVAWLSGETGLALARLACEQVFLGLEDAAPAAPGPATAATAPTAPTAYVALDFSDCEAPESDLAIDGLGQFRDLREVGALLPQRDGSILAYARGLMHWHRRHRFCGACGAPTESRKGGHVRVCTRPPCGLEHFPRTDPAVIMLVHDGRSCVLGRRADWPAGMHSTLAGFVEPGESLEEAVAREVREEAGLEVPLAGIRYNSSQPWPFPASIMLGFHARAERAPLTVYPEELESVAWFSRERLLGLGESDELRLPRKDSIARRLIEDWLAEG